jgi:serine protein kinase
MKLVNVLKSAALGFGPEKRVILLHGPVGSAKSTIVRLLKKAVEWYSRTPEGALYSFEWQLPDGQVVPSPMHEDPLRLIPSDMRTQVMEELNRQAGARARYRIDVEGDLDPVSSFERGCGRWTATGTASWSG